MNFQKIKLGLVALVLGFGLVVTQSAFTAKTNYNYYNTTGVESNDPLDYVYDNRPGANCSSLFPTQDCSATWSNSTAPMVGSHPDGDKISDEDSSGKYIPGSDL